MRKRIELPPAEMVKFIIDEPEGSVWCGSNDAKWWKFSYVSSSLIKMPGGPCQGGWLTPSVVYQDIPWWENIPEEGVLVYFDCNPSAIRVATNPSRSDNGHVRVSVDGSGSRISVEVLSPVTKDNPLIKGLIENS